MSNKQKFHIKFVSLVYVISLILCIFIPAKVLGDFNPGNLIDDQLFSNYNSMTINQIDNLLNSYSSSCISSNNGFLATDPIGYSPAGGYKYGANVSAGQIIYDASQVYQISPQVILVTLEKEQSLVSGSNGCSTGRYVAAMGYGCPDNGSTHSYSGINLYTYKGTQYTSISATCVNSSLKAGFAQQVIHAAWLLAYSYQRSLGNISWNEQWTNFPQNGDIWDNSDDPTGCYSGPMTAGNFQNCPKSPITYFDGKYQIDSVSINISNGATAALYWYTPHFSGNQSFDNIWTSWFGSLLSCYYPKGSTPPSPYKNMTNKTNELSGNWTPGGKQGFAYVTNNSSGGFDVSIMSPVNGSLQWQGIWWNQLNSQITSSNTIFIPGDYSGDGLTDLYYATSINPNIPGFTVGIMINTGNGFKYGGSLWSNNNLTLSQTRFIPGNWTPGGKQGFAYTTSCGNRGFDVSIMSPVNGSLQWQGLWWHSPFLPYLNTLFIPGDYNGDGLTDLYYATPNSGNGLDMAIQKNSNNSFVWNGILWSTNSFNIDAIRIMPY